MPFGDGAHSWADPNHDPQITVEIDESKLPKELPPWVGRIVGWTTAIIFILGAINASWFLSQM